MGVKRLVDKTIVGTTVQGYSLFLRDGFLGFQLANGLGSGIDYISTALTAFVADGAWHHIAVTVDRMNENLTGGKFYVDGNEVDQFDPTNQAGSLANASPLRLAVRSSSLTEYYRGALDEVELFHRVLTPAEIQGIFRAGSSGKCKCVDPPPAMEAWWRLDETSGTTATDIANFPTNGTHVNGPVPVAGMVAGGLSFDGVDDYVEVLTIPRSTSARGIDH